MDEAKDVICPKCGAQMRAGTLMGGTWITWRPGRGGGFLKSVDLAAYACPDCGHIELNVRNLEEDREKILKADV
jgi:predicted RNA-binding Zn-ribbon protein involved in translation (DUF1610 family)